MATHPLLPSIERVTTRMHDQIIAARQLLQAGDKIGARAVLMPLARTVPTGEVWYLLGQALDDAKQRQDCLVRAAQAGWVEPLAALAPALAPLPPPPEAPAPLPTPQPAPVAQPSASEPARHIVPTPATPSASTAKIIAITLAAVLGLVLLLGIVYVASQRYLEQRAVQVQRDIIAALDAPAAPTATSAPTPTPFGLRVGMLNGVFLRYSPSMASDRAPSGISASATVLVQARTEDSKWLKIVRLPGGPDSEGWVQTNAVDIEPAAVAALPVDR